MSWLLNCWVNLPPYKGAEYIQSKNGKKFWVLWRGRNGELAKFRLYHSGLPVGHVHTIEKENRTLCLADIFVEDEYQRLGLGKQMMQLFLERARQMGYQEIYGHIKPSDENPFEYLQEWYKRQGFEVNGEYILFDLQHVSQDVSR